MINYLLFIVLPYAALTIFLIGSIYRYRSRGFSVSSISSQFLEGRRLFWGSQPFHWGLFFLFFGHLIAFLFPRAVLAWNGQPVRLLILEITAFVFGLSALLGLLLLVRRRLITKRVKIVTSKMDIVVFVILLVQIISGLMVAYYSRWGSSWFASFITPYLRSIFVFDPQMDAIASVTSVWLKVHVVSAFTLIGIIPFTRFMHFLVYPLDYTWRSYQQVIWNWNRRYIRTSRAHSEGHKSQNN
ncbi:MAG: respiratory nitrate reductase subunit gamma [Bacteroidia bacterium]|nr:respiratory nitrate reductase subunit gamma [Bacteroidia bacterium]MCZ2277549.1 respiratory nitrate reductase subunit gamma [Bacteroidia bacterium]